MLFRSLILCQFFVDQAVGNGDYEFYLTQQIGGSGSSYRYVPKTTATVASGVTAIAGQSIMVAVRSGDVLTAYLDGLAGDTTTPDTTVRWFEMAALRPTTADRTIAVDASGLVDLVDAPNATAVAAIQDGLSTFDASTENVQASNVINPVLANVVQFNYQYLYQAVASSVSGVEITTNGIKNYIGAALADDSLAALVGWQVFFYKQVSGYPPTDVFWRATIVSYTETVITVDAMPDGFSSTGFTLYIMPPGWGSIASDAPTAAEIRAEMDSNSTQLAAIVEDTGTTLPASISALSTLISAELSNTSDSTASGAISRTRGNTWSISATIGAITGYTSLWFTVKHSKDDADADAILQIRKNASETGDGLIYKNGSDDVTAGNGSITVSDDTTGAIITALVAADTDDMPVGEFYYDIQVKIGSTITTPDSGTFTVTADVTRSIT